MMNIQHVALNNTTQSMRLYMSIGTKTGFAKKKTGHDRL